MKIDVKREEIDAAIEKLILDNAQLSRPFKILLSNPRRLQDLLSLC
ncbi:hypothetical protein [Methylocystis rosea]|nr:hypothetical protein [Methylocystis rosea]